MALLSEARVEALRKQAQEWFPFGSQDARVNAGERVGNFSRFGEAILQEHVAAAANIERMEAFYDTLLSIIVTSLKNPRLLSGELTGNYVMLKSRVMAEDAFLRLCEQETGIVIRHGEQIKVGYPTGSAVAYIEAEPLLQLVGALQAQRDALATDDSMAMA